jgi:hypothetical protein
LKGKGQALRKPVASNEAPAALPVGRSGGRGALEGALRTKRERVVVVDTSFKGLKMKRRRGAVVDGCESSGLGAERAAIRDVDGRSTSTDDYRLRAEVVGTTREMERGASGFRCSARR